MDQTTAAHVEAWFVQHDGNGDFISRTRSMPYSVIGSAENRGRTIFTTKPQGVLALLCDRQIDERFGLIGGYGLPTRADLPFFRRIVGRRSMVFLGDLDPTDLMIFAWLRACLRPMRVSYLGVSDALMKEVQAAQSDSFRIPLSRLERSAMSLLPELFPDFQMMVGSDCAGILKNKRKLEVEAVLQGKRAGDALLAAAFGGG